MKSQLAITGVIIVLLAAALLILWLYRPSPFEAALVEGLAERPRLPPPANAAIAAEPVPAEPLATSVLFGFDRADLSAAETAKLDELVASLKTKGLRLEAVGHADRIGSAAYNLRLSQRRADAVKAYVVKQKAFDPGAVQTSAKGESEPATAGYCAEIGPETRHNAELIECLQPDRRVDVTVLGAI